MNLIERISDFLQINLGDDLDELNTFIIRNCIKKTTDLLRSID